MSVRLVTVATFDLAYKADICKAALEEAGIRAEVNDREIINMDWLLTPAVGGVKLQVAEEDAERALVLIEPLTRPGASTPPVSDEELERQALAAPTEDEERAARATRVTQAGGIPTAEEADSDRDKFARRAAWCLLLGLVCLPVGFFGMYFFLTAAFVSGPISPAGRFNLRVSGGVAAIMVVGILIAMTRFWRGSNP